MLTLETITEYGELLPIKDIWNELLTRSDHNAPYLRFEWFTSVWERLDDDKELYVIIVKDEKEIIAIAPFLLAKKKLLWIIINKLCFITSTNTPFQDFILTKRKEECLELIVHYLVEKSHFWNIIELDEIRADSNMAQLLKKTCQRKGLFYFENN